MQCRWRGRLNTLVQCGTITGIVIASAINIGTNRIIWGWRISLALAAVPGSILLLGAQDTLLMLLVLSVAESAWGLHWLQDGLAKPQCTSAVHGCSNGRQEFLRRSAGPAWV